MADVSESHRLIETRRFGEPSIRGTTLRVSVLLREMAQGASEEELLAAHSGLTTAGIRAALADAATRVHHRGWLRRWRERASRRERLRVDVAIGLVLPVVLLQFDPAVFQKGYGEGYLGAFKAFCLVTTASCMATLVWWLATRIGAAFCSGAFAVGVAFAVGLGVVLLPLSLIGLLFAGIGLLGMTPFVMALVYGWRAAEAWGEAGETRHVPYAVLGFLLPLLLGAGVQVVSGRAMRATLQEVQAEEAEVRQGAQERLARLVWLRDPAEIERCARRLEDPVRLERVREAYLAATGRPMPFGSD